MNRLIFILLVSIVFAANAQNTIVFHDKKGKYGLMDQMTDKVIVKPKYYEIHPTSNSYLFIIANRKDGKLKFGLLDSKTGKEVFPVKADTIIFNKNTKLASVSNYNKDKGTDEWSTCILNYVGDVVKIIEGRIVKEFPGGYILSLSNDKNCNLAKADGTKYICDKNFNTVGQIGSAFLFSGLPAVNQSCLDKNYVARSTDESGKDGYVIYNPNDFKNRLEIYSYDKIKSSSNYIVTDRHGQHFGLLNSQDFAGEVIWYYNKYQGSEATFLFNLDGTALRIGNNGKTEEGKRYTHDFLFAPKNDDGTYSFRGMLVEDLTVMSDGRGREYSNYICFRKNNLWGVYDISSNKIILSPVAKSSPIRMVNGSGYALKNESNIDVYDSSGKFIFSVDGYNPEELKSTTIDHWVIYGTSDYRPEAIFNNKTGQWLAPFGKYKILQVEENDKTIIALSNSGELTLYNWNGVSRASVSNIKDFHSSSYGTMMLINIQHKMGVMNLSTGKMITPFLYTDDMLWGRGKGNQRRFVVEQRNGSTDILTVYTVGGKKIASKAFPSGSSSYWIEQFAAKYLY